MHAAISSHAMAVSWFLQPETRMIFFRRARVPAHLRARRRPSAPANRWPRGRPAYMSDAVVVRISRRSSFPRSKKGHHRSGDGPWSKTRKLVGFWLHHSRCRRQVNADADKDEGGCRQEHVLLIIARGETGSKRWSIRRFS